jgi:voltage-gated potassium channel
MNDVEATRRLINSAMLLAFTVFIGTVGYRITEDWDWADSLYMVFITLTTVGFSEVHPLSAAGRVWTVLLLASGVGVVAYTATTAIDFVVEGNVRGIRRRRRMDRQIRDMENHVILCGYGRVGRQVAEDIRKARRDLVVVELKESDALADVLHVIGNAEEEATLLAAGIERAAGLVAAVDSDSVNVFITLTAKSLRPDLRVIARASDADTVRKLERVGADRVVSPYLTSGQRMAHLALSSTSVDFYEFMAGPADLAAIQIHEIVVTEGSQLEGRSLQDLNLRQRTGVLVVALRAKGQTHLNPDPGSVLETGSVLMIMGSARECQKMRQMSEPASAG